MINNKSDIIVETWTYLIITLINPHTFLITRIHNKIITPMRVMGFSTQST